MMIIIIIIIIITIIIITIIIIMIKAIAAGNVLKQRFVIVKIIVHQRNATLSDKQRQF